MFVHIPKERYAAAAAAKSLQSYPTLCNPIDGSPPGSPVPGILQARTLEWVAISFSNAWKWKVKVKLLSCIWLSSNPMDCSPPGSSIRKDIAQFYLPVFLTSEISSSLWLLICKKMDNWDHLPHSECKHTQPLSCIWLFATPWTVVHQAPLSMGGGKSTGAGCHYLLLQETVAYQNNAVRKPLRY